jgi:class 3 adenylate cyclase/tetratricopeptide (TPR) repeat protein
MSEVGGTRAGTATVLFTDLVASTQVRQALGDERADDLRRAHDRILREAITSHGGTEVKGTGDGLMVTFAAAAEAVSAAVEMQRSIFRLARRSPVPVAIRIGISAGDVAWEHGDYFGTPVVEASRLCDVAEPGAILASEVVRLLAGSRGGHVFHPVGALELKGLDAPLPATEVEWAASAEGPVPLPSTLAAPDTVSFVGRATEFDRLRTAWKSVGEAGARLVVVSGEPGVGKTRLVAELARRVHDEGAVVLFGRCDEDLAVPYQPFVEALGAYVAAVSPDELADQAARYGGDLARLVPVLRERVPALGDPLRADPDTERYRLFESVAAFLRAVAAGAPTLLVLDDLHWAGKPELLLVRHLLRAGADAPVLLVGTYRDTDLDRRHPLAEALSDLRRDDAVDRISLSGLKENEVTEFLEAAAGHPLGTTGAVLAGEVYAETDGNPFFVGQVLRHLVESGAVVEHDGEWVRARGAADIGIPEGIREVIGRRLATLTPATNDLLDVAAVVGREFPLDVVRDASGADADAFFDALEEAEAAHLIEPVPDAPRRRSFVHALLRSTLYDEIPTTRRLRMHRRVAQSFEARADAGDTPALADLARHYCEAAALGETANAVRYARAAGQQALDRLAYEEAAGFYERALAVLDPEASSDRPSRAELLLLVGRARWASGDRDGATAAFYDVASIARSLGDAALFAEAAIACGGKRGWTEAGVVNERVVALLEEALTVLPPGDHSLRAACTARLASELYFLAELSDRRRLLTEEAVAMARRVGDRETLALVLSSARWGGWVPGSGDRNLALSEEMLRIGIECGDREIEASALIWMVVDLVELGRTDEAASCVERELALATDLRQPEFLWAAHVQKTCLLLMAGDYEEAAATAEAGLAYGQAAQSETSAQMYGVAHLHLARARGGIEAMEPLVADMVERYPLLPAWRTGLALIYRELERDEDLRAQVEILARDDFGTLPNDANWTIAMVILAISVAYLGDVECCRSIYEKLFPLARYAVTAGMPADCLGPIEMFLAPLAVVLERWDDAEEHFRRGGVAAVSMRCRSGAALGAYEYANALHRHGGEARRAHARVVAAQAARQAKEANMTRLFERARAMN